MKTGVFTKLADLGVDSVVAGDGEIVSTGDEVALVCVGLELIRLETSFPNSTVPSTLVMHIVLHLPRTLQILRPTVLSFIPHNFPHRSFDKHNITHTMSPFPLSLDSSNNVSSTLIGVVLLLVLRLVPLHGDVLVDVFAVDHCLVSHSRVVDCLLYDAFLAPTV